MEIPSTQELLDANTNKAKLQLLTKALEEKVVEHEQGFSELVDKVQDAWQAYQNCLKNEVLDGKPANKKATRDAKKAWEALETERDEVRNLHEATKQALDKARQDFDQAKNRARNEATKALREGAAPYFYEAQDKIKEAMPQFIAAFRLMNGVTSNYERQFEILGRDRADFDKGKKMADDARWIIERAVHADPELLENA